MTTTQFLSTFSSENFSTSMNTFNVLNNLQQYMLTDILINKYNVEKLSLQESKHINNNKLLNNMTKILDKSNIKNKDNHVNPKNNKLATNEKKEIDKFSPSEKDKLFWCFYILINGFEEYEL